MKKQEFVIEMHLKPQNQSKSLEFFFSCVEITRGIAGIEYEQIPRILKCSIFGLKIARMSINTYLGGRRAAGVRADLH